MPYGFLAAAGVATLAFAALTVGISGIALAGPPFLLAVGGRHHEWSVGVHAALAVAGFAMALLRPSEQVDSFVPTLWPVHAAT